MTITKKLLQLALLLVSFFLLDVNCNAQFVKAKKKQKTPRHGQWEPQTAFRDLLPKTVILNLKYPNYIIWQEKLGSMIENPDTSTTEIQIKQTYTDLFNKANTGNPGLSNDGGALERAKNNREYGYYAKLCAFVYYADMDKDLDANDHWQKLSTNNKRNHFRDRAIGFMKKIDYAGHINGFEKLQYSSKGLLMALQAYDLLKAAGGVPQSDLDDMKYSLQWWAKDVYRKANNERYKNMMLYCES